MRYLGPGVVMIGVVAALVARVELPGLSGADDLAVWGGLYLGGALWWVVQVTRPDRLPVGWALLRLWLPLALPVGLLGAVLGAADSDNAMAFGMFAFFAEAIPLVVMGVGGSIVLIGRRSDRHDATRRRSTPAGPA